MGHKKPALRLETVGIAQLQAHPQNARQHSTEQLNAIGASIKEMGWARPVLVNETYVILAGHGAVAAAKQLGLTEVPVVVKEGLTQAQERAYVLADNALAERSTWDSALLSRELSDLKGLGIDLSLTGFHADELFKLLGGSSTVPADPDFVPPRPTKPKSRHGDVWVCGDHRIACGDATEPGTYQGLLEGRQVDLTITSPPYNVGIKYGKHKDRAPREQYLGFLQDCATHVVAATSPGRFVCWNVGVSPKTYPAHQVVMLEAIGLSFYRQIVWEKSGVPYPTFQTSMRKKAARHYKPNYKHELILIHEREAEVELDQGKCPMCAGDGQVPRFDANLAEMHGALQLLSKGEPEYGDAIVPDSKYSSDVWNIAQSMATVDLKTMGTRSSGLEKGGKRSHMIKEHPAAYPVELPRALMSFLSARGEAILDPFAGSGSTMIAAEQLGRRAHLIDYDARYVDVAVTRWQRFTGREAVHGESGRTFNRTKPAKAAK